jgi:hypothetical protein
LTTTSETLGSAKASVLRRVTTTTFLHSGFLIRSCTMCQPTFPVAPSTIAEHCAFASPVGAAIVTSHARGTKAHASPLSRSFYDVSRVLLAAYARRKAPPPAMLRRKKMFTFVPVNLGIRLLPVHLSFTAPGCRASWQPPTPEGRCGQRLPVLGTKRSDQPTP